MASQILSADVVDAMDPPVKGEIWIGDAELKHFCLRLWAGKNGGGKAFAIRLRSQFGDIVRETFVPSRDSPYYFWRQEWTKPTGYFLDTTRSWARDRIAIHKGKPTSEDRKETRRLSRERRILAMTIRQAFDARILKLQKKSKDHEYVDQIQNLIGLHIPGEVLVSTLANVSIADLANAVTNETVGDGSVKVLRAFVSSVFKRLYRNRKLRAFQKQCREKLDRRNSQIIEITDSEYESLFGALEAEIRWRQALAIRFYFATGAGMQHVLKARWSNIIDDCWYPLTPVDRETWYRAQRRLGSEAKDLLALIKNHHVEEKLESPFLFPSLHSPSSQPIKTTQRCWAKNVAQYNWSDLPMLRVVSLYRKKRDPIELFEFLSHQPKGNEI